MWPLEYSCSTLQSCGCRPSSPGAPLLLSVVTQRTCSFPLTVSPLCGLLHYSFFFLIYILVSRHSVISLFIKAQSYRVFINFILQSFALPQYIQASQYFSRGRLSSGYTMWHREESFLRKRGTLQYFLCILANRPILYLTLPVLTSSFQHNAWPSLQASFELKKISYQEIKWL